MRYASCRSLARPRARRGRAQRRLDVPVGRSLAQPHLHRRDAVRVHERDRSCTSLSPTSCSTRSPRGRRSATARSSGWRTSTRAATRTSCEPPRTTCTAAEFRSDSASALTTATRRATKTSRTRCYSSDAPQLVAAFKYLQRKGGVLVEHGYTHQWDGASNPYNGITGDDVEFYRVTETEDGQIQQSGPLPGDDSIAWTEHRIVAANREFAAAGLSPPKIFEFPHYAASDRGYRAAAPPLRRPLGAQHVLPRSARRRADPLPQARGPVLPVRRSGRLRQQGASRRTSGSIAPRQWHSYKSRLPQGSRARGSREPRRSRRLRGFLLPPVSQTRAT